MERTNSGVILLSIYLLLAVFLFPFYSSAGTLYELTDWATAVSLVEYNSLDLNRIKESAGVDFESTVTLDGGGSYSNKPPGLALMSAPIYAMTRVFLGEPNAGNMRTSWFVLRLIFSVCPLFLLALWLHNREVDSYSLAILLFATPMFSYSMLFYPHVLAAVFVYFGFRMMYDSKRVSPETCFSASFLLGIAALCDYTAFVPMIVFAVGLLATEKIDRFRRVLFYLSGLTLPVAGLLLFHYLVFGSPFAFVFHWGISFPTIESLYTHLVLPSQGLLSFSPILIFACLALIFSNDAGTMRHNIKLTAIFITYIVVCGYSDSPGAQSIGPRHLIIIMPLLLDSIFDGEVEEYPSHWRGLVFTVSFVLCTLPLLTYAFAPNTLVFPHNSFWVPLMIDEGVFGLTILNTVGYAVTYWTILPAAVLLLIALCLVWRDAKFRVPFAAGIAVGCGLLAFYFFAADLEPRLAEKYIEQTVRLFGK